MSARRRPWNVDLWEYRVLLSGTVARDTELLNELGAEGWEVCGVVPGDATVPLDPNEFPPRIILKRWLGSSGTSETPDEPGAEPE